MIINMNMGSIDKDIDKDRTAVLYKDLEKYAAPQIPAPPPPPPPIITFSDSSRSLFQKCDPKPRPRLRNFNWEAIPAEKVKGRTSLWSSETFQGDLQIDTGKIEELFGKQEEEVLPKPCYRRRSISIGDACLNKVFLLDSRRSMNIGIFLKQFKRSAAEIVEDIKLGRGDLYTSERLNELLKHLPDREEFRYCLRLEALILKKDFYPAVLSQLTAARDLTAAAEELLQCTELHFILKLVLKAGNFMNAGGYAGNAAGFRVSSLLKLADTKANKPGMNLLHFVVMEVQKQDPRFLSFADKLQHVHNASKWAEDGLLEEFYRLRSRITSIHQKLAAPELQELRIQMAEFLEYAVHHLREVQKEIDALQASRQNLSEFLCEDEDTFRLEECCKVFSCFCQKFQLAIKENNHREEEDQRQKEWEKKRLQKRHSMATCGALEVSQSKDELEFTLERNLRNTCRPLGRRVCRVRSLGRNSTKSFRTCNDQDEDFQEQCDQKIANQMRKVSEHVLRQQMEYKSQKSGNTDKNNTLYRTSVAKNGTSCQSEAKDDLKKVSLLISKQKTEILQLSPETYGYPTSDPTSDQPLVGYLILESTQQSKPVDGQDMQISSHHCTSFPPQESTSHWEPKCTSQILLKPIIVHSDVDNASQSQTQFNHVCLTTETQPDNLKAQVSNPLKEMDTHDNDPQILDQSCFPRQMLCLSAHKTFPFSEGLDKLDNQVHEMYTKSVMQCTSKSSMQAVSNSKEVSENNLRNDNSLQILDHNESENPGQSSDFQGLIFSKQTNGLNIMTESSSAPKTSKPLNQVTSKTTKQTVKSLVRNTKRSVAVPGSPVTSPSIPTRFDASNQNQIVNKSETPKPRRSQSGYLMSKIKPVEPLSFKQSNTTKETNDHFPSPKEKNVEPSNETSRGPQYMDYNVYSKSVKDGHTMVQKESHSPCSKWKRELRNTSEKANGVRAEPLLENNVGSNKNNLDHRNGDTIKNSVVGRNGKSIPKKSKTNDLGIRRVPLTKDLFMGSVSTSVVKQPIVTPKHVQKESKTPLKISLVTVGASKSTPGKTTGTVKDKEDSLVNNNDYGKSENSGSPSITSKHCVPSSLKGEAMTPQPSPKKSTSVARVTINVTKHSEVNTTPTRGTRNTYSDTHPIWR
ncbi:hypothetical protein GDO78_013136 [Eleutherodactylus coqui]|uniref:FH2 domain-containing protein n=1 Tax=Eleutherodactylus coqui TaxID=57060 RepID=A0A8J6EXP0_ELECQ|nr:hypothetical protein GDO78_013136 [Eleutherodactylus coqui]